MAVEGNLRATVGCYQHLRTTSHIAYEVVGRAAALGKAIKLVDKRKLNRMITPLSPKEPWMEFIKTKYPDYHDRFTSLLESDAPPLVLANEFVSQYLSPENPSVSIIIA